jgi:WD40 repeat protein
VETSSFNRREILKKLVNASVVTTVCQIFGVGQSNSAISAIASSENSENVNIFNIGPRLNYDFLSPIAQGIGGGIGEFTYSIGESAGEVVKAQGQAAGDIVRGVGEGIGERLRDLISNSEGKRKLQEYSLQQDFQRKREIIGLMRDSLREFQAQQIDLKLTEIQANWDLQNWNGILSRQETEDLLKEQKDCLLILLSPPEISLDAPASIRNNLEIELNSVEAFLVKYYPNRDKQHLVKFYSDYFKRPIGNINVEQLHRILAPVPTAILDMDVTDYAYTVKVHFWGVQNNQRRFYSSQAWNWENGTKELLSKGADEKEALQTIRQTIVNSNKLLAAYIADLYYLNLDPYYQFQLPKMTAEFTQSGLDKDVLNPYLTELKNIQQTEQQTYEKELKALADEVKEEENIKANEAKEKEDIRANAQKWRLASTLSTDSWWVNSVAISPDGKTIASGGDHTIQLWDLETGQLIDTLGRIPSYVYCLTFSPDGQTIAADGGSGTIKLWTLNWWGLTKKPIRTLEGHYSATVRSVAFTPDGQTLVSGCEDKTIKLWNLRTGKLIGTLEGHLNEYISVAISPDGQTLASTSYDGTIKLWDLKTKKPIRTSEVNLDSGGAFVVFSPDGQTLASDYGSKIKLWNVKTGKLIRTLEGHSNFVTSVAFSSEGQTLASGGSDQTIKIWDLKKAKEVQTLERYPDKDISGSFIYLAFSPDGHTLVSGSSDDKVIKIWRDN